MVVLSDKDIHDRNEQLSTRVQQLEDALARLQSTVSSEPHPLLSDELLSLKSTGPAGGHSPEGQEDGDEAEGLLEDLGTLHISHDGGNFYGSTALSELFIPGHEDGEELGTPEVPVNLLVLSTQFPFYGVQDANDFLKLQIRQLLPPLAESWRIAAHYFERTAWLYRPFPQSEFVEEVLTPIYKGKGSHPVSGAQLSVLCIVLALGTHSEGDSLMHIRQASFYQQLSKASLALDNVLSDPPLVALWAVFGLCCYAQISGQRSDLSECSMYRGVLLRMAFGMGLHRDPSNFKLSEMESQRRRRTWWEIHLLDSWLNFGLGLPPPMSLAFVDTKLPVYPEDDGDPQGWHHSKIDLGVRFLQPFLEKVNAINKPKYSAILEFDSFIRTHFVYPLSLKIPGIDVESSPQSANTPVSTTMQKHALYMVKDIMLVYLHRGYFARAIQEHGQKILECKHTPSVVAVYRSACAILRCLHHAYSIERQATSRVYFFWSHGGTAAIALAAFVVSAPGSPLAIRALSELDQACQIFEQEQRNRRVSRLLPTLLRLRQTAHHTYFLHATGQLSETGEHAKELTALAGESRLVCKAAQVHIPVASLHKEDCVRIEEGCILAIGDSNVPSQPIPASTPPSGEEQPGPPSATAQVPVQFEGAHPSLYDFLQQSLSEGSQNNAAYTAAGAFMPGESTSAGTRFDPELLQSIPEANGPMPSGSDATSAQAGFSYTEWDTLMRDLGISL